jgi:hypothetical protein
VYHDTCRSEPDDLVGLVEAAGKRRSDHVVLGVHQHVRHDRRSSGEERLAEQLGEEQQSEQHPQRGCVDGGEREDSDDSGSDQIADDQYALTRYPVRER